MGLRSVHDEISWNRWGSSMTSASVLISKDSKKVRLIISLPSNSCYDPLYQCSYFTSGSLSSIYFFHCYCIVSFLSWPFPEIVFNFQIQNKPGASTVWLALKLFCFLSSIYSDYYLGWWVNLEVCSFIWYLRYQYTIARFLFVRPMSFTNA